MMRINNFRGDLPDISAKKEALVPSPQERGCVDLLPQIWNLPHLDLTLAIQTVRSAQVKSFKMASSLPTMEHV